MDTTQTATVVVSAIAILASCLMIWRALRRYLRASREGLADAALLTLFARRRTTMGLVLFVVAVLLFLGMCVLDDTLENSPTAFTWWWLIVLLLLVWLIVLAIFDMKAVLRAKLDHGFWRSHLPRPPRKDPETEKSPKKGE